MRRRGFESHPVLLFFDNSIRIQCTHDVAAAYCLAMADVRVRLPLGAFVESACRKVWESACFGSRRSSVQIRPRRLDCGGARVGTGERLLTAPSQVRFLPPQLCGERKGKPIGDGSCLENSRAMSLEGSTPSPSALNVVPLAERLKAPAFQAG